MELSHEHTINLLDVSRCESCEEHIPARPDKLGTAWTGDGEGATVEEFNNANHPDGTDNFCGICQAIDKVSPSRWGLPTNLRLTGAPLTPYDIERILSPEFRISKGGR